ncbi:MAG: hypothetical protein ACW968_01250 [Candidatus Thorarchaeota archaeon]
MPDKNTVILVTITVVLFTAFLMTLFAFILGLIGMLIGAISILMSLFIAYAVQKRGEDYTESEMEELAAAAISSIKEELIRNYCTAEVFWKSLLSTTVWDTATQSGIILRMEEGTFRPLLDCYSAIGFYNYDLGKGNFGEGQKQKRVKELISEALSAIDADVPSKEECCNDILVRWATKEKLDEVCRSE